MNEKLIKKLDIEITACKHGIEQSLKIIKDAQSKLENTRERYRMLEELKQLAMESEEDCELKAYRKTGYTPEQVQELHDKHWSECRQIALYDDQIKQMQEHIDRLKGIIDGLCGYIAEQNP